MRWRSVRGALVVSAVILGIALLQFRPAAVSAITLEVDFDEVTAPCAYAEPPNPLGGEYSALGVQFSSQGLWRYGEILNECAATDITGHSGTNFLVFGPRIGGDVYSSVEVQFDTAVESASIRVGAGADHPGSFTLLVLSSGRTIIHTETHQLTPALQTVSVSAPTGRPIRGFVLEYTGDQLIVDDVVWSYDAIPTTTGPGAITVPNDPGLAGAVVDFDVTATDPEDGALTPTCTTPSGSFFRLGAWPVNCFATDSAGQSHSVGVFVRVLDVEPPELTVPANITVTHEPGKGVAAVSFDVTATDNSNNVAVECDPPTGHLFPVGTTTVTCTATDYYGGLTDIGMFTVTVSDTEAPSLDALADVVVENDPGQAGAHVSFSPAATDNSGSVSVSCSPLSGSFFQIGTTPVSCAATDGAGLQDQGSFNVTVNDVESPVLIVPTTLVVDSDPGVAGALVAHAASVSATDNSGVTPTIVCSPASGTLVALGTTTVTCTASDTAGNSDTETFTVTVNDVGAPLLNMPVNLTVPASSPTGAIVRYTVTATDNSGSASVVCTPPPGSHFPVGTTLVSCTATDPAGNSATASFPVSVADSA